MRYCPDCGAECQHDDKQCSECKFPLSLKLLEHGDRYKTTSNQKESWRKTLNLLRKSGIHIVTQPDSSMTSNQAWVIFPGIGIIVLILSVLFSQTLAQWLLPVKTTPVSIDFNQNLSEVQSSKTSTTPVVSDSLLMDALKSTEAQADLLIEPEVKEIRRIVPQNEILQYAQSSTVSIRVGSTTGYGSIFLPGGYLLTSYDLTEKAYQRIKGNVSEKGSFVQGIKIIEPQVQRDGYVLEHVRLIHRIETPPVSILQVDNTQELLFPLNFQKLPDVGDELWITFHDNKVLQVEKVKVVESVQLNQIPIQVVDFEGISSQDGHPVFNVFGEMVGILVTADGRPALMANIHLREKAPYIYRDIHSIITGKSTAL